MIVRSASKLSNLYQNFLHQQTTVLDDQSFGLDSDHSYSQRIGLKGKVCILSRNYYSEMLEWLPIIKRSDVIKVVKLKVKQQKIQTLYVVGIPVNGKTPVVYFHIKALPQDYSPWLIIPETYILAFGMAEQSCQVCTYKTPGTKTTVYFSTDKNCVLSAQQGGAIAGPQQFAMSNGIHFEKSLVLDEQAYAQALSRGLMELHNLGFYGFINKSALSASSQNKEWVYPAMVMGSVVASLYLLLGYAIASWQADQAEQALSQSMAKANQVLEQRNSIQDIVSRVETLQSQLPADSNDMAMWRVLEPLYASGVVFTGIVKNGVNIELKIEAVSASEVLQLLLLQEGVENAEFSGTVRRQRTLEAANIHFRLVHQGAK
jgi:hypothetical protein